MNRIVDVAVHGIVTWCTGRFEAGSGDVYEFVFTRSLDMNIDFEERELVNVEKQDAAVDPDDPVWQQIRVAIQALDPARIDSADI